MMSVLPPAANGTMRRTVLAGYCCARGGCTAKSRIATDDSARFRNVTRAFKVRGRGGTGLVFGASPTPVLAFPPRAKDFLLSSEAVVSVVPCILGVLPVLAAYFFRTI